MASQITSLTIVYPTVYSRRGSKKTSNIRVTKLCEGNSPVTGEFPAQRPVTRSFDAFSDHRLNGRLSKQSRGWWLRRHRTHYDVTVMLSRFVATHPYEAGFWPQFRVIIIGIKASTLHLRCTLSDDITSLFWNRWQLSQFSNIWMLDWYSIW